MNFNFNPNLSPYYSMPESIVTHEPVIHSISDGILRVDYPLDQQAENLQLKKQLAAWQQILFLT